MSTSSKVSFGSAFAAIWTPKRVVFGSADKSLICTENIYFALSGLTSCTETEFDAIADIGRILADDADPDEKLEQIAQEIEEPLCQAAQYVHDQQPDDFKKYLSGKNALDALFFYKRGDSAILSLISFRTKKRGKAVVLDGQQKNYPDRTTDIHSIKLITAGMDAATEKFFVEGTTSQQALVYPQEAIKKVMQRAVAAGQTQYPVRIFEMNPSGMTESVVTD